MELRFELRTGYLVAQVGGTYDAEIARRLLGEILVVCKDKDFQRVLIDARGLTGLVSIAERFDIALYLSSQPVKPRIAVLVSEAQNFTKTLEDTAVNRGAAVRTTDDLQEALDFLKVS